MKYAEATVVSVEIHVLNTLIKVEVKDNGKGAEKIKKALESWEWKNGPLR